MGKSRNRKRSARTTGIKNPSQSPGEASAQAQRRWSARHVVGAITFIVTALGLVSALLSFQTKFTVTIGEALVPDDIESIPFEFLNDSPYAIDWIRHSCEIHAAQFKDETTATGLRSFPLIHRSQRFDPGQGRTVFCVIMGREGTKTTAADIGLRVTYKPWFSPFEQMKEFRFDIASDPSGKLRALRKPSSEFKLTL